MYVIERGRYSTIYINLQCMSYLREYGLQSLMFVLYRILESTYSSRGLNPSARAARAQCALATARRRAGAPNYLLVPHPQKHPYVII